MSFDWVLKRDDNGNVVLRIRGKLDKGILVIFVKGWGEYRDIFKKERINR